MYFGRHRMALDVLRAGIAADEKLGQRRRDGSEVRGPCGGLPGAGPARARRRGCGQGGDAQPSGRDPVPGRAGADRGEATRPCAEDRRRVGEQAAAADHRVQANHTRATSQCSEVSSLPASRPSATRRNAAIGGSCASCSERPTLRRGHYAEALRELELCIKRRGETTGVFAYDAPTIRYFPPAYYWLARAQEGVGAAGEARKNYEEFLKLRATADPPDALATDARQRLTALSGS